VAVTQGGLRLDTGDGNGGSASIIAYTSQAQAINAVPFDSNPQIAAICQLQQDTTNAHITSLVFGGGSTPPSETNALTAKHFGFICDTATLSASNANGTSQTTTDITSGVTIGADNGYHGVLTGTTNYKSYVNKTLKATHTTNLPAGDFVNGVLWQVSIDNDAGNSNQDVLDLCYVDIKWDMQ